MPGPALAPIIGPGVLAWFLSAVMLGPAPAGIEVRWRGEPGCVEGSVLPERVARLMGGTAPPGARLTLSAEREGEAWRIGIELEQPAGIVERTLEGSDCMTLTEAVALVVAVQVDPVAVAEAVELQRAAPPMRADDEPRLPPPPASERIEREEGHERAKASGASVEPVEPVEPIERRPSRARPRLLLTPAIAGEVGVLPRGAAAFALGTGIGWTHALLELGGSASVGPDAASAPLATVGGRFRLFTGVLRGCGLLRRARVEPALCGALELGDLRATGTGLLRPSTVDALWVATAIGARVQWIAARRVAVGGLLDLVVPLLRHRFAIPEVGRVHGVAPVVVRLGVQVQLRLP